MRSKIENYKEVIMQKIEMLDENKRNSSDR